MARDIFRRMELQTWGALASSDLEFSPLLPDDDLPLEEIVSDLSLISRAGLGAEEREDPVDADFDLAEITEYVRVSVQILFEAFGAARDQASGAPASMSEH